MVLHLFAGPLLGYVPGGDERGFPTYERNRTAWRALPDDRRRSRNCIRKTDLPGSQQAYAWAVLKKRPRPRRRAVSTPLHPAQARTLTRNLAG